MTVIPDLMPMLSPGKHRSPRSGGCFMEIASFLAGERWSDHPKCTDPALAELARCVNDVMPDSERSRLSLMIPSVIGTAGNGADPMRTAALVVRDCALQALPLVTVKTRPLACALIVAERVLGESTEEARRVLATQPAAWAFANEYVGESPSRWRNSRAYMSLAVPQAVRCAVQTVSEELADEAPEVLVTMLHTAIDSVRATCGLGDSGDVSDREWRRVCALVGATTLGT